MLPSRSGPLMPRSRSRTWSLLGVIPCSLWLARGEPRGRTQAAGGPGCGPRYCCAAVCQTGPLAARACPHWGTMYRETAHGLVRDAAIARPGGLMDDSLTLLTRANAREILAAFKLDRLGRFQPAGGMAGELSRAPAVSSDPAVRRYRGPARARGCRALPAGRVHRQHAHRRPAACAATRGPAGGGEPSGHDGRHGDLGCPGAPARPEDHRVRTRNPAADSKRPQPTSFRQPVHRKSIGTAARGDQPSAARRGLAHLPGRKHRAGPGGAGGGAAGGLVGQLGIAGPPGARNHGACPSRCPA